MAALGVPVDPSLVPEDDPDMARSRGAAAQKRCWNCRSRKTACDRTQPSCKNCLRRGLDCLGYGLKLSWPRPNDTKRSTRGHQHRILPIRSRKVEFVNATTHDIEGHRKPGRDDERELDRRIRIYRGKLKVPITNVALFDPFLQPHNYSALSKIIFSKCDEISNLYSLLVKMSLGDEGPSALAIRHAMAALSFQHLGEKQMAALHQTRSLHSLQAAVDRMTNQGAADMTQAFRTMAASMLLNIFETLDIDSSPIGWAIFFCGTKRIANLVHTRHATYDGDRALILDWILYHDTLYKFCVRHWAPKMPDQVQLAAQEKIMSKAIYSPMRQLIVPSAGCSLELLDLICRTTDAVHDRSDPRHLSPSHLAELRTLEFRIGNLKQYPRFSETTTPSPPTSPSCDDAEEEESHTTLLAELYRVAAQIYLARVARGLPRSDPSAASLVTKGICLLSEIKTCERPWPLFVVALEAGTDEERRTVLDVFDATLPRRPLGNLALTKRMVLAGWVRQDLSRDGEEEKDMLGVYEGVVSSFGGKVPPSFT
ncbi:fungal-specific transcription factor domain-containing protein [Echria macrotheca]|uniref:Fungal-specific transcription factor domain-containing protein n=1 Tax=Echria macrotheca TaxID=438768 RepID=A0AAJ0F996_9PEZI|nr:fungal-specific transcription factor domain-containing protein [Echria macrotheca]